MKQLIFAAALLTTMLFVSGLDAPAQSIKPADIEEITLADDGGFGFDRGHEIVLHRDGTAEYTGGRYNFNLKGKYRGQFDKRMFARLAALLIKRKFFSLQDRYEPKRLDAATVTTGVAYNGKRKTVQNYGQGGGRKLSEIENAIAAVANEIKWEPIEERHPG